MVGYGCCRAVARCDAQKLTRAGAAKIELNILRIAVILQHTEYSTLDEQRIATYYPEPKAM